MEVHLDTPDPTLAEFLASRGYQTAGFSANTNCCNYETGLGRGFAHFEDFPLTPRSLLGRTVAGNWILTNILYHGHYHDMKWIGLQSRGARDQRSLPRLAAPAAAGSSLLRVPELFRRPRRLTSPRRDIRAVSGSGPGLRGITSSCSVTWDANNNPTLKRDVQLARDCYDDCIAFLDEQLGRLLDALRGQGLLDNTVVIITSDHGEAFGDHGHFGHSFSLYLDVIGVPLVILAPGAPAGRVVDSPVSLRDLPATVVDQLGLSAGSPFPGRSLAAYWRSAPGQVPQGITTPALSEQADETAFQPQPASGRGHSGFQMSLVASGHHYIRDGMGAEMLFDLRRDPSERVNLMGSPSGDERWEPSAGCSLRLLTENPGSIEVEKAYLEPYRQESQSPHSRKFRAASRRRPLNRHAIA